MITEGTYPYVVGGVSTWCVQLVNGLPEAKWQILPITAGSALREPRFPLPPQAELVGRIDLWSEGLPPWRPRARNGADRVMLPAELTRQLLGWNGSTDTLVASLRWCRRHPERVRAVFRNRRAWRPFLAALADVLDEEDPSVGPAPEFDLHHASQLYQSLYWLARVAAVPTPATDLLLVTAAGWSVIPALVHRSLHGTPMLLVEHGVFVREAYLGAVRADGSPSARFLATRLARGLTQAAYSCADIVAPVSDANARWAEALGVPSNRICVIRNGIRPLPEPAPLPGTATVISVGRLDPLKDIHTMLMVAAEVVRQVPAARFLHYGPVSAGQEGYAQSCQALHEELGLGDRFRFMGSTPDPVGVIRDADVVIMTSISEGFPMSLLEAMSQGRPIVTTGVGGVPEAVAGCSFIAPPGHVDDLAAGVVTLLRHPWLAQKLGDRGYKLVTDRFSEDAWLLQYRQLLLNMAAVAVAS